MERLEKEMYNVRVNNDGNRIVENEDGGTVCIVSAVCEDRFNELIELANREIKSERSIADKINDIKMGWYSGK